MRLDTILNTIQKYYSDGVGILYNEKELIRQKKIKEACGKTDILQEIAKVAKGYPVVNWTDDMSCCYEYKVLLHLNQDILDDDMMLIKSLNGIRYDLRIFISKLAPFFYSFIEKTEFREDEQKWLFFTLNNDDNTTNSLLQEIDTLITQYGYKKLKDYEVKALVPNVQTELVEINKVNVFHCLFTDLINL